MWNAGQPCIVRPSLLQQPCAQDVPSSTCQAVQTAWCAQDLISPDTCVLPTTQQQDPASVLIEHHHHSAAAITVAVTLPAFAPIAAAALYVQPPLCPPYEPLCKVHACACDENVSTRPLIPATVTCWKRCNSTDTLKRHCSACCIRGVPTGGGFLLGAA